MTNNEQPTAPQAAPIPEGKALKAAYTKALNTIAQQEQRIGRQVKHINDLIACCARRKEYITKLQAGHAGEIEAAVNNFRDENALLREENARLSTANERLLQQQRELQAAYDQVLHDGFTIRDERDNLKKEVAILQYKVAECNPDYIDWLLNERTLWQRIRNVR